MGSANETIFYRPAVPLPVLKGIETWRSERRRGPRSTPAVPLPVLKGIETCTAVCLPERLDHPRSTLARLKGH